MSKPGERGTLGAVSYLNTRPLICGLREAGYALEFDVPSVCWQKLVDGSVDLGLVPVLGLGDDPRLVVVPRVAIGCHGAVRSVLLLTRKPIGQIGSVACDTSSRSSAAMVRILLNERYGVEPRFRPAAPNWRAMLTEHDAALIIGDAALDAASELSSHCEVHVHDLGQEWVEHTGLPFVFAVWAGYPERVSETVAQDLARARDRGLSRLDELVDDADRDTRDAQLCYLREAIHYQLGELELRGLRLFLELAHDYRLIPHRPVVQLLPSALDVAR